MKKILLVTSTLLMMTSLSFAGDRVGNGGDVIVCDKSIEPLDSFEMRINNLSLEMPGETIREKVAGGLGRYGTLDPLNAEVARALVAPFLEDVENYEKDKALYRGVISLFTPNELVDIDDSNHEIIPRNCRIEQLIVLTKNPLRLEKKFLINRTLWDQLSLDQKALMVLHEAFYMLLTQNGAQDSKLARYLNGIFNSRAPASYSYQDYFLDLKQTQIQLPLGLTSQALRHDIDLNNQNADACKIWEEFRLSGYDCYPLKVNKQLRATGHDELSALGLINSGSAHFPYALILDSRGKYFATLNIIADAYLVTSTRTSFLIATEVRIGDGRIELPNWGPNQTVESFFTPVSNPRTKEFPYVLTDSDGKAMSYLINGVVQ